MRDYVRLLPAHAEHYVGENDLFLEVYAGQATGCAAAHRPPLLLLHGAYTGGWMWSKYIPRFLADGWDCLVMNLRAHYRSRQLDLTRVTFEDYLDDIMTVLKECAQPPVLAGFSMGGILAQKVAETAKLAGLVVIDSSSSREVHAQVPYREVLDISNELIVPAPTRNEPSIDESAEDIAFQKKYLAMESAQAFRAFSFPFGAKEGISIDGEKISCPCLVIKSVNSRQDEARGRLTAEQLRADYSPITDVSHTGLLVGQRYSLALTEVLRWLRQFSTVGISAPHRQEEPASVHSR